MRLGMCMHTIIHVSIKYQTYIAMLASVTSPSLIFQYRPRMKLYRFSVHLLIGAHSGLPHTSGGTELWRCVCNVHACLWLYTVNFKCAFQNFPKIERPRALYQVKGNAGHAGLLPECSIGNRSGDSWYLTFGWHSTYGPTINGRLLADRTKLYTPSSEIALGNGRA